MSNTPLPEPYGRVTMHTVSGLEFFYRHPEPPYLDTAKSCTVVYTWEAMHAHAAAVSAAKDAEIAGLRKALAAAIRQNEHDMLMTGEELRAARAALGDKTPNAKLSGREAIRS